MFVRERFQLNSSVTEQIKRLTPQFGFNGFGEVVFYRTYSRTKPDGTQESWSDVVIRVINGVMSIRKDHYVRNGLSWDERFWQDYASKMAISLFYMEWMPPGRGLWAMGTDFVYERGAMSLYNCAFTEIHDDIGDAMSWIMDVLMQGVGVGFNPVRNDSLRLHSVTDRTQVNVIIPDTREGWCESVVQIIEAFQNQFKPFPIFDYSKIRKKGEPIKGFGGLASGPEPLMTLHTQIVDVCSQYLHGLIDSVRLKADIANMIGCCVVAGNVRRSAELACGPINDKTFLDLKNYELNPDRKMWGWMSNNSVLLQRPDDFEYLGEIAQRVIKNGEPGYINSMNLPYGRLGKNDGLREDRATGFNPCQPAWTKVITPDGIREFKDIDEGSYIWGPNGWTKVLKKWSSGVKNVYAYHTQAGTFYSTENHRILQDGQKIEVKDALSIDTLRGDNWAKGSFVPQAIVDGLIIGDGYFDDHVLLCIGKDDQEYYSDDLIRSYIGESYSKDYTKKIKTELTYQDLPRMWDREIPQHYFKSDRDTVRSFLRGLYSANGSVICNRITLKTTSFKLVQQVQMMLSFLGIRSYYTTNKPTQVEHHNGIFVSKESYDVTISTDRKQFVEMIGFIQQYKNDEIDLSVEGKAKESYEIISVEYVSTEEVFDITVDNGSHSYWSFGFHTSNCGEIPLESREVCNLVETLPTMCDSIDDWYQACEYATVYSSTVSLLPTNQQSTNKIIARNRRIGVSIIDITGWIHERGLHKVIRWLRQGYQLVRSTNSWVNGEAGIPDSIRVTTVKPGGTTPKLPGRTPGMSFPNFHHTLRRIRVQQDSPIYNLLIKAGVPHEPDVFSANTECFEFPVLQGPARHAGQVSLWEQAMLLTMLQREWADNAVSNTLNFRPKWRLIEEIPNGKVYQDDDCYIVHDEDGTQRTYQLLDTIKFETQPAEFGEPEKLQIFEYDEGHEEDIIENVLSAIAPLTKSVSLLPHSAQGVYPQMPEEGITEDEYNRRLTTIQPIDWTELRNSDGIDERYCSGPACEIRSSN